MSFLRKVISGYQVSAEQTAENWRGEGCKNYDDSQDVCLDNESDGHHESGISAEKTIDSLMYHMMREDAKKWSMVKTIEEYVSAQNISNEYMAKFAKKLSWLGRALHSKYSAEEEVPETEGEEK